MGQAYSTSFSANEENGIRKFKFFRYIRSVMKRHKKPPAQSAQKVIDFLDKFPRAPEDWSDVQKVLVVENEIRPETARPRNRQGNGRRWIVHLCILQSNDPGHKRSKWTFVKLDTQAEHSVMFESAAKELGLEIIEPTESESFYYGINDQSVACIGWVNISFMLEGCNKTFHAHVDILQDSQMEGQVRQPPFSMLLGQEVINIYEWIQPSADLQHALHHVYRGPEMHDHR